MTAKKTEKLSTTELTLVIFRTFPQGDVIALFPLEPGDTHGIYCSSYQRIGQHGQASEYLPNTRPSTPDESLALRQELTSIGYVLKEGKRIPRNAMGVRLQKIKEQRA